MTRYTLAGSERRAVAGARRLAAAEPTQQLEVLLVLRHGDPTALQALGARLAAGERIAPLTREAYAARFGAHADDVAAVAAFARQYELTLVRADPARCVVVLAGTVARLQAAFGVELHTFELTQAPTASESARTQRYRGRIGHITLPDALREIVTAVLGLDNRPQARTHFRFHRPRAGAGATQAVSYTPPQVAALYQFPDGDGSGQCIGLIELGGGYRPTDLTRYFAQLDIPAPKVVAVSVDGASNQPSGNADGPDGEVVLDIEVAGSIAPGAQIAVYFAANTDAGFIDAVSQAIHDTVNRPSVVSISWGGPESSWTAQATQSFNQVLQEAAVLGVTVCVAAGDGGASDGTGSSTLEVDFPASSPYALACGGTRLRASGSTIVSEVVWNDGAQGGATGGGISTAFALPSWQQGLQATNLEGTKVPLNGRGVPDVAGNADPETGYAVWVDGSATVVGGTSAVAPLWAGLIARINAKQAKPIGYVNPILYEHSAACRPIVQGNNGGYEASIGWNACAGLGSPNGEVLGADL